MHKVVRDVTRHPSGMSRDTTAVELGGIEPPSMWRLPTALRPFPASWLYGCHTGGSGELALAARSFPDVSGLPHRQRSFQLSPTASVAGLR